MHTDATPQALQVPPRLVHRYLVAVMIIGTALMALPAVTGLPAEPFILAVVFVPLLGGAVFTARRSGPGGERQLFRRRLPLAHRLALLGAGVSW